MRDAFAWGFLGCLFVAAIGLGTYLIIAGRAQRAPFVATDLADITSAAWGMGFAVGGLAACKGPDASVAQRTLGVIHDLGLTDEQRKDVVGAYAQGFAVAVGIGVKERLTPEMCQKTETLMELDVSAMRMMKIN